MIFKSKNKNGNKKGGREKNKKFFYHCFLNILINTEAFSKIFVLLTAETETRTGWLLIELSSIKRERASGRPLEFSKTSSLLTRQEKMRLFKEETLKKKGVAVMEFSFPASKKAGGVKINRGAEIGMSISPVKEPPSSLTPLIIARTEFFIEMLLSSLKLKIFWPTADDFKELFKYQDILFLLKSSGRPSFNTSKKTFASANLAGIFFPEKEGGI